MLDRPSPEGASFRLRLNGGSRQVFGLAGPPKMGFLPAVASQSVSDQCSLTAFVPAHRCGAVPDSHRIPC